MIQDRSQSVQRQNKGVSRRPLPSGGGLASQFFNSLTEPIRRGGVGGRGGGGGGRGGGSYGGGGELYCKKSYFRPVLFSPLRDKIRNWSLLSHKFAR